MTSTSLSTRRSFLQASTAATSVVSAPRKVTTLSNAEKISDPKLSNIDIESIIEDKKQSIMKIVYESVQISISNKKVLLKP